MFLLICIIKNKVTASTISLKAEAGLIEHVMPKKRFLSIWGLFAGGEAWKSSFYIHYWAAHVSS